MGTHKTFWKLAWPAAAEGLLLMLLTAADLQMVSALGTRAVAAVGIFSQPRIAILCLTRSYSVALSAYVARLRGQDADYPLTSCTRASLIVGVCISFVVLILTWIVGMGKIDLRTKIFKSGEGRKLTPVVGGNAAEYLREFLPILLFELLHGRGNTIRCFAVNPNRKITSG